MDVVHSLLRSVVRGFYDTRAIIIMDAVLVHHVLSDRELVTATGIPSKDVRATCARLREDHLLKEVSHRDGGIPGTRAYTQTVYYIHFTEAVDAVKWKMHFVESKLKEELDHQHNAQDYVCDVCGSHYETIDALSLFDPETQQFLCGVCGNPLREDDAAKSNDGAGAGGSAGGEKNAMEELMTQLEPLIIALKRIDELSIPENTFESELQLQVPLIGVEHQGPATYGLGLEAQAQSGGAGSDKSGITIAGSASSRLPQQVQSTFQVNITSEAEQQSQLESEANEKKRLAEENALPDWHAHSTVSTEIGGQIQAPVAREATTTGSQSSVQQKEQQAAATDAMEAYYRKLQEQQAQSEDEEAGELDEFEDVI